MPTWFNNAVEVNSQIHTQEPTNDMHLLLKLFKMLLQPFNSDKNNQNMHFLAQMKLVEINSQKRRWEIGFSFYQKCYLIFFCLLFRLNYPFLPLEMQSKGLLWMVARYEQINPILTFLPFFLSTFLETCYQIDLMFLSEYCIYVSSICNS